MKTYYIRQRISLDDKYYVYDVNNEPYIEIKSKNKLLTIIDRLFGGIFTLGNKMYMKYLDGKEIITIIKKSGFLKEEYALYNGGKEIATLKQHIIALKPKISIITQNDNYLINGDLMAKNFTIYKNNINIAQIKKTIFNLKDNYKINIFDDKEKFICISFLIVIDNSIHN